MVAMFAAGEIVSAQSVREIWSGVMLTNGSRAQPLGGWRKDSQLPDGWMVASGGARAAVAYIPAKERTIVVLTNTQGAQEQQIIRQLVIIL